MTRSSLLPVVLALSVAFLTTAFLPKVGAFGTILGMLVISLILFFTRPSAKAIHARRNKLKNQKLSFLPKEPERGKLITVRFGQKKEDSK